MFAACTASTGRMKNRPEHAQAEHAGEARRRRAPRRWSFVRSWKMWRRECETRYSSRFHFSKSQHGSDPHSRRAHAQPEEHQPRAAAQPARRDHRAVGLGQELARVRHALRRRPAPLRRVAVGLRAPVPRADGEARRRPDRGPVAGDRDRAEGGEPQPALDRRHGHRDPRLPAPALRARRHALLPGARARARGADRGADGRPGRARCPRTRR